MSATSALAIVLCLVIGFYLLYGLLRGEDL